jgi:hypothetical protein
MLYEVKKNILLLFNNILTECQDNKEYSKAAVARGE